MSYVSQDGVLLKPFRKRKAACSCHLTVRDRLQLLEVDCRVSDQLALLGAVDWRIRADRCFTIVEHVEHTRIPLLPRSTQLALGERTTCDVSGPIALTVITLCLTNKAFIDFDAKLC